MWIVSGSKDDRVVFVSSKEVDGILPVGSYLTVTDEMGIKHILIVEESTQRSLFEPSPLVVDAGFPMLKQDQECKNILLAREIKQFPLRTDGMFGFIRPGQIARKTDQSEIDQVFKFGEGFPLFLATSFLKQNSTLRDERGTLICVRVPLDSLYLQTMICGQTGSGKTVAMKYIIERFLQQERGAVFAINVKSIDLLTMDQPTSIGASDLMKQTSEEWNSLKLQKGDGEFSIYVPFSKQRPKEGVTRAKVRQITLRTRDLEPNALLGVLRNVTDRAAEALPNIFRYWKERALTANIAFREFITWFKSKGIPENKYTFPTLSSYGEESEVPLHPGTFSAIIRSLESAIDFFDNREGDCLAIREEHIMVQGKLSVVDLSNKNTTVFGAVLLRHLLSKIYDEKAIQGRYQDLPVLIVIDEVHQFYRSDASVEALEELNAIARMGRSEKIGVIFASQNPQDLPDGLTSIVNTRIFFRSLENVGRKFDFKGKMLELSSLDNGYAAIASVALPQIRFVKFPMPLMGVRS